MNSWSKPVAVVVMFALGVLASAGAAGQSSRQLSVPHKVQHTPVWCWAAAMAMVIEYVKGQPLEDCEVLSAYDRALGGPGSCCTGDPRCQRASLPQEIGKVLNSAFGVQSQVRAGLSAAEVRQAIDAGSPIIAWVWHTPVNAHVFVISGYDVTQNGLEMVIHDPMKPGSTVVPHGRFAAGLGPAFKWNLSWIVEPKRVPKKSKAPKPRADAAGGDERSPTTSSPTTSSCGGGCDEEQRSCVAANDLSERQCLAGAENALQRKDCSIKRTSAALECINNICGCLAGCPGRQECVRTCNYCERLACGRAANERLKDCQKGKHGKERAKCNDDHKHALARCSSENRDCVDSCPSE